MLKEKTMTDENAEIPHGTPEEGLPPSANDRFKWYIIHAYSGFERKGKESTGGRVAGGGLWTAEQDRPGHDPDRAGYRGLQREKAYRRTGVFARLRPGGDG